MFSPRAELGIPVARRVGRGTDGEAMPLDGPACYELLEMNRSGQSNEGASFASPARSDRRRQGRRGVRTGTADAPVDAWNCIARWLRR